MNSGMRLAPVIALLLAHCADAPEPADPAPEPGQAAVGIHYYTWYDELHHWDRGVAHEPLLGRYRSEDRRVAERHIEWMSSAGIDVVAVDWFRPDYPEAHLRLGLLRASNLHKIRWCLFYDTAVRLYDYGYTDPDRFDFGDPFVRRTVVEDIVRLAEQFFGHPRYFRIHGRPVLWVYLTRSFVGPWIEAFDEIRRRAAERGHPVYLIADEVWYGDPDPQRLRAFDAVGAYLMYDLDRTRFRTSWSLPEFNEMFFPVYERWQAQAPQVRSEASGRPVAFLPGVAPQFQDASVRGDLNPPVLAHSRQQVVAAFAAARDLAARNADPEERLVWVTSFNEWHEGTSIEPTVAGGPAFPGGNYGFELLQAASEAFGGSLQDGGASAR
jgi:hypothetical protein